MNRAETAPSLRYSGRLIASYILPGTIRAAEQMQKPQVLQPEHLVLPVPTVYSSGLPQQLHELRSQTSLSRDNITQAFTQLRTVKVAKQHFAVNSYRLIEKIDGSGLSDVFRAKRTQDGEFVAVHRLILTEDEPHSNRLDLFTQEAAFVLLAKQDNVIPGLDFFRDEHNFYLVLPYLNIPTLRNVLMKQELTLEQIKNVMDGLFAATRYAAEFGMYNRTIRPENVFCEPTTGQLILSNWGTVSPDMTATAEMQAYLPPEEISENSNREKASIYQLGLLLFEMITGKPMIAGETIQNVYDTKRERTQDSTRHTDLIKAFHRLGGCSYSLASVIFRATDPSSDRFSKLMLFQREFNESTMPTQNGRSSKAKPTYASLLR